jgi:hypothetical protein
MEHLRDATAAQIRQDRAENSLEGNHAQNLRRGFQLAE